MALVGEDGFGLFSCWIRVLSDEHVFPILLRSLVNDF